MSTSRLLAPALAVGLLFVPAAALGQTDATPRAGSAAQSAADDDANPAVGSAVPYLSETGEAIGTVTAVEVTDPFDDFSESFQIEEGSRFVAVEVAIAAAETAASGEEPFQANASDFDLQTADGFLYAATSASRDISSSDIPDLETIAVDPGTEVGGLVFFQIPAQTEIALLFYTPGSGRLILVADLR